MNDYIVNLKDPAARPVAISADGFEFPEDEWGHLLFYTGTEKDPTVIHTISFDQVLSVVLQPQQ